MNLKGILRHCSGVTGTLEWDSDTGDLGGSFARQVSITVDEVVAHGSAGWGPQHCLDYPVRDPLHTPAEMAVVLDLMGFILPASIEEAYPEPPADLLEDPDIDDLPEGERPRIVH